MTVFRLTGVPSGPPAGVRPWFLVPTRPQLREGERPMLSGLQEFPAPPGGCVPLMSTDTAAT